MKGQLYSVIAMLIIIPMVVFLANQLSPHERSAGIYEKIVSDQIHQVEKSAELDFERALLAAGKRALIASSDYVIVNGKPLDDGQARLIELMENGSIFSNESLFMHDNTLSHWIDSILGVSSNFQVVLNYSNVSIGTYNGTEMEIAADLNISVSNGMSGIEKNVAYDIRFTIEKAGDPIYPLNTNGLVTKTINFSPHEYRGRKIVSGSLSKGECYGTVTFDAGDVSSDNILVINETSGIDPSDLAAFAGVVVEAAEDISGTVDCFVSGNSSAVGLVNGSMVSDGYPVINIDNATNGVWHLPIRDDIESSYYFPGSGPDYLSRLEGKLGASSDGLESFVDALALSSYGIPIKQNQISVDYLYFSNQTYNGCPVRGLPGWFRLNSTLAAKYGIDDLLEVC
jgi:hypothetical protein